MIRGRACRAIIFILPLYLALALALPMLLLVHELGVLTGDPAHGALDDHAWLDHAAGSCLSECGSLLDDRNLPVSLVEHPHPNPLFTCFLKSGLSRGPPLL